MKTDNGSHVDLISGVTGRKPLGFDTDDTVFVRMPHGKFSVRVVTPAPTNVEVTVDGVKKLKATVPAGQLNMLAADDEGGEFVFGPRGEKPVCQLKDEATEGGEPACSQPAEPLADTHGLITVSVQFAEQPATKQGPAKKAGPTETVQFQMNQPGEHERALASNVHRLIPPEGVTKSGCSCCK
jgi:hypothetical protein